MRALSTAASSRRVAERSGGLRSASAPSSLPRQIGADVARQASGLETDDRRGEPESPGLEFMLPEFKEFARETGQRFVPTLLADVDASPSVRAPFAGKLTDQDVVLTILGSPMDAAHDPID